MSDNQYKTFFDEIQDRFRWVFEYYHPYGVGSGCLKCRLFPICDNPWCPKCGYEKTYIHEHKHREVHGGTFNGVPVIYGLDQLRHICPICGATFVDTYDCLPWGHGITAEAENYILTMLGSMPMELIASNLGLSVETISNRAEAYAREQREVMLAGHYKYLSMDEVFIGYNADGSNRIYWVLNDNSLSWKSNNIMISVGRTRQEVADNLRRLIHGNEVIAVSTDMWQAYLDAIREVFPNAVVIADRFHVIGDAEKMIDAARKKVNCPKADKEIMKKDGQLFLTYWMALSADQMAQLDDYLSKDKKLEETYYLIQEFMDFYSQPDYDSALEYLCQWESKLFRSNVASELMPFYNTLVHWLPYIMNYFLFRITNGRTEGKNNLLREIDKMGFHYGIDSLQACFYSHDRNQELIKWRRYQHKILVKQEKAEKVLNVNRTSAITSDTAA